MLQKNKTSVYKPVIIDTRGCT